MDELFLKICGGLAVALLFMIWLELRSLSKGVSANYAARKTDDRRSDIEIWLYQINENVEKMAASMEQGETPPGTTEANDGDAH